MSSEWSTGKLGEFVELKRGYDLPQAKRQPGTVPLVSSSGVSDRHNVAMVKGPGVVTGRYGTIGQVFYVEDDFWPLNTTLYVRDFKGNDRKFIHYFLKTLDFNAYSDKAAVPGVNRNHLHEAVVSMPSVSVQSQIAAFLGSLDDRITLLRETNATLEAIAQTLYKSWFVDFDPVREKEDGGTCVERAVNVAADFPSCFEDSSRGTVPYGWRVRTMSDVAIVSIGKTPPRNQKEWFSDKAGDIRWASIRDMGRAATYISSTSEFLTNEAVRRFNVNRVPDNTVILSFKMTIGRVAITDGEMATNEAIAHFKPRECSYLPPEYIYLHLKQFNFDSLSSTSSIADAVNSKTIRGIEIIVPNREAVEIFSESTSGIFKKIKENTKQIESLSSVRDILLPRLIDGRTPLVFC